MRATARVSTLQASPRSSSQRRSRMRTSLLVCLSSVGFLPCQSMVAPSIGGTLQTTGPFYGNYAIEGTVAMHDGWKAHAVLPAGISSTGAATGNTSATTIVGWHTGPGPSIAASVSEQGSGWALLGAMDVGTTPSPLAVRPDHGEHTLTMIVLGVPDQRGKLETWASGALRGEALATMMVDVGADGTTDFAHQATAAGSFDRRQWDLRLDGAGQLVVAIRTGAKAKAELGGAATYLSALTVRFTAGTFCDMATDGPACGARLTGYDRVV